MSEECPHIRLWVLEEWDGGDGRCNRPSGFVTQNEFVEQRWRKEGTGRSSREVKGVLINSYDDIEEAKTELARQKALAKLSEADKRILGLI